MADLVSLLAFTLFEREALKIRFDVSAEAQYSSHRNNQSFRRAVMPFGCTDRVRSRVSLRLGESFWGGELRRAIGASLLPPASRPGQSSRSTE